MTLPKTSRAAVFLGAREPFVLQEFPVPKLESGDVLVEVLLCTICGSDLHTYHGRRSAPTPSVLGHEIVGRLVWPETIIDGIGNTVRAGERLLWSLSLPCGSCTFCVTGLPQKCERLRKYGHEAITPEWALSGGLADYCVLRSGTFVVGVPEAVPDTLAAPAGCATATVAGAIDASGDLKGKSVLVVGAGVLGLTACAMLDAAGAGAVMVADTDIERAAQGSEFGARRGLDASLSIEDFVQSVRDVTGGQGADVVFELAGANPAVERAIKSVRTGGLGLLIGSVYPQVPLPISIEDIVRRRLTVRGIYNYAPADLVRAVKFLSSDAERYPLADLIEASFPLDAVNQAFDFPSSGVRYRVAVAPGENRESDRETKAVEAPLMERSRA